MVYLNEGYSGGETHFRSTDRTVSEVISPHTGTLLLFNHDVHHAGESVLKGTKYILRTDGTTAVSIMCVCRVLRRCVFVCLHAFCLRDTRLVMFKRVDTDVPVDAYRNSPCYQEAMALYVINLVPQRCQTVSQTRTNDRHKYTTTPKHSTSSTDPPACC